MLADEYQQKKIKIKDPETFSQFQRIAVLKAVDDCWVEQVDYLQQFQSLVISQGYAQKNPVYEFHKEAFASYQKMNEDIKLQTIKNIALSYINVDSKGRLEVYFG